MKYAEKLMVVPYVKPPVEDAKNDQLSVLAQNMRDVLDDRRTPADIKTKLYGKNLNKFLTIVKPELYQKEIEALEEPVYAQPIIKIRKHRTADKSIIQKAKTNIIKQKLRAAQQQQQQPEQLSEQQNKKRKRADATFVEKPAETAQQSVDLPTTSIAQPTTGKTPKKSILKSTSLNDAAAALSPISQEYTRLEESMEFEEEDFRKKYELEKSMRLEAENSLLKIQNEQLKHQYMLRNRPADIDDQSPIQQKRQVQIQPPKLSSMKQTVTPKKNIPKQVSKQIGKGWLKKRFF